MQGVLLNISFVPHIRVDVNTSFVRHIRVDVLQGVLPNTSFVHHIRVDVVHGVLLKHFFCPSHVSTAGGCFPVAIDD